MAFCVTAGLWFKRDYSGSTAAEAIVFQRSLASSWSDRTRTVQVREALRICAQRLSNVRGSVEKLSVSA
jgi:hypothetical protein